jgi:hypothetical protein
LPHLVDFSLPAAGQVFEQGLPIAEEGMAAPVIKVLPTPCEQVLALLHSDVLRGVEQAIAAQVSTHVVEDYSPASTSYTQAEASVSGLTVAEIEALLRAQRDQIISFGVQFLRDEEATRSDEEYPEGEEQEPPETAAVEGLGTGFGIKYAIYYNFLANRTQAELLAFLKNRRIPHHARFARDLRRVFDQVRQ